MGKILVTGASGHVGSEVVRKLLTRHRDVVAADYKPGRIAALFGERVTFAKLDFTHPTTWPEATRDVEHMFLVRPPAISNVPETLNPFIDVAREQGVDHVVFLSVAGAERNKFVPHRSVEDHLRALNDHYTNLRPGFFAQNLESAYRQDIVDDRRIYVPAGSALVNWIDARDIGEVAATVLCSPPTHRGRSYTLTGQGPIPWSDVTNALSHVVGESVRYEPASVFGYVRHLRRRGLPATAIAVQTVLHYLLRFGQGATYDDTLEVLLGRRPRTLEQYVHDHAAVWRRAAA